MADHRPPRRRSSQETLSLLQLDPSPIDYPSFSPAPTDKELPDLPEESMESSSTTIREGSTSAPGLSGSGHGAIYYLMRTQRLSSYAMAVFTSLHLANVSLIPAITRSVAGSETYLLMTREIYQTSITEPLLVALPIVAHVGSGIAVRLLRRWQNMQRYGGGTPGLYALHKAQRQHGTESSLWPPLSYISISGYIFAIFLGAHVVVNRLLPLAVEGDSSNIGLAYVAHGFARHRAVSSLAYVGLLATASGHMVWGAARWLGWAPSTRSWVSGREGAAVPLDKRAKKQRRRRWFALQGVVVGVAALWAMGGLGVVARGGLADGWVGNVYDNLFKRVGL